MATFLRNFFASRLTPFYGLVFILFWGSGVHAQTNYTLNPNFETNSAQYWWANSGNTFIGSPYNFSSNPYYSANCVNNGSNYLVMGINTSTGIAVNNVSTTNSYAYTDLPSMPSNVQSASLVVWYAISTNETSSSTAYDNLWISLYSQSSNTILTNLGVLSNLNNSCTSCCGTPTSSPTSGSVCTGNVYYNSVVYNIPANYLNSNDLRIRFTMNSDGSYPTIFRIDGVFYNVTTAAPCNISLSSSPSNASCGQSNGYTYLYGSGGSGSYQYNFNYNGWSNSNYYSGLSAGNYNAQVRDANNTSCTSSTTVPIGSNACCNVNLSTSPSNANCGQNNGTITVYGSGASSYQYSVDGSSWTYNNYFTGLGSGWHSVEVRDANNTSCTNSTSEYVGTNGIQPSISSIYDVITCVNSNVPIFQPSVSGATSLQWYFNGSPLTGQTNATLQFSSAQPSNAGQYYLMAYNGSCSVPSNTATLTIQQSVTNANWGIQSGATQNGSLITLNPDPNHNATSFSWTIQAPNGTTVSQSTAMNPSFTPNLNGDYTITHRAISPGCTTTVVGYLNITPNYSNNSPVHQNPSIKYSGDPVNTATGEYTYAHDIMSVAARNAVLNFKVFFMGQRLDNNELGYGWRHNWQIKMTRITAPSGDLEIRFPNGRVKYFTEFVQNANPRCVKTYLGETDTLIKNTNGTYTLRQPDGTQYVFENSTGNLLSLTDLNNTTFTLTYTAGKLTKITAPGGRYIDLFYTGNALTSVKNQENHIAYFTQNANNDLVKITNVRGGEFDFVYIGNSHYIQTVTDPNNNVFVSNVYTGNKVTSQTLADLGTFTFQYNTPVANATTVIDQLGHSEVIYYDANWNLIQQRDAMLNSQYWTYNSNRMLQTYQDELGHITTFGIAANGNVTDVWSPTQRHTHSNFTSLNRPDDIMNALNIHTTIVYNSTTGNPTQINLPNTGQINLAYNNDGTVLSVTDAMSRVYSYEYNAQGDVWKIHTPTGDIVLLYDLIGRVRFITDQLLHQTEIQYDNWGNILKTISQLGFYEQFTYDDNGNMLTYRDRKGFITSFTYDNMDRVQTIVQPGNRTTTFIYTLTGKIFKITYPNLAYIENTYNAKDLLIQRKNVLGGISTFTYLANGLPESITLPNTYHVEMTYNDENEAKLSYDGYVKDSLFHNAVGNVIKHSDDQGHFSLYQFDNMNQLEGVSEGGIANVTLDMNLNGELTSVTDPNNHTATTTLQPNTGFPTSATDAANHVFATTFDNAGNMSGGTDARSISNTITRNANDEMTHIAWSNGEFENFVLDNSGSPTTVGNQNGNFVLTKNATTDEITGINGPFANDNITYTRNNMGLADIITYEPSKSVINTFNNAGQNLTVKDWQNHTVTTAYDNMGVPTGKTLPNGITENFTRNTKGEILTNFWVKANGDTVFYEAFVRNAYGDIIPPRIRVPQLYPHFAAGVQNNTFAANDAQNNAPFTSDNNGNILTFPIDTLNTPATATYDAKNRMITLVYGSTTIQNYYDALNLLIKQVKNGVTRLYIWDIANGLPHIIRETDGNGVTIASYVWADDVLVSRIDASGNTLYYILDYKGNVVALTDANANITDQYAYGTFGENMKHIGNTDQPFTWQGGYGILHQVGNLYYIRQRWHLGSENRFLSQDVFPADAAMSQTLNRYVYGLNDGNRYSDVTGWVAWIYRRPLDELEDTQLNILYSSWSILPVDLKWQHPIIIFDNGDIIHYSGEEEGLVYMNSTSILDNKTVTLGNGHSYNYTVDGGPYNSWVMNYAIKKAIDSNKFKGCNYDWVENNCQDFVSDVLSFYDEKTSEIKKMKSYKKLTKKQKKQFWEILESRNPEDLKEYLSKYKNQNEAKCTTEE